MAYEQKPNTGSLFKNDKKQSENSPNLKGQMNIDGKEYWVSAWTKQTKNGDKWISLAVKPKERKQEPQSTSQYQEEFDDDVPF